MKPNIPEPKKAPNIGALEAFSRVLDLPPKWAAKEAASKLAGTWMVLNGRLVYIESIGKDHSIIYKVKQADGEYVQDIVPENGVVSLEIFLPTSGVYKTTQGNTVVLSKNPLRQWRRSYTSSIYNYTFPEKDSIFFIEDVLVDSRTDIWVSKKGLIFYYDTPVGRMEGKSIICTNKLYEQELLDWIKNGHATKAFADFQIQATK